VGVRRFEDDVTVMTGDANDPAVAVVVEDLTGGCRDRARGCASLRGDDRCLPGERSAYPSGRATKRMTVDERHFTDPTARILNKR
jgi:hypothetical protein